MNDMKVWKEKYTDMVCIYLLDSRKVTLIQKYCTVTSEAFNSTAKWWKV